MIILRTESIKTTNPKSSSIPQIMNANKPACGRVSVTIALLQLGQVIVQECDPKIGTPTITGIVCGSGYITEGFAEKLIIYYKEC